MEDNKLVITDTGSGMTLEGGCTGDFVLNAICMLLDNVPINVIIELFLPVFAEIIEDKLKKEKAFSPDKPYKRDEMDRLFAELFKNDK